MISYKRQEEILKYLSEHKSADIEELSKKIYCSPSTVRRDLNILQDEGKVRRTRGGVILIEQDLFELPYHSRMMNHYREKQQIAGYAEPLVEDDMTLFLDSSSTCMCLARKLKHFQNLKLLTNNPFLAYELSQNTNIEVYCAGGRVFPKSNTIQGADTCKFVMQYHSDIFFVSCRGLDAKAGPTDFISESAQTKYFFAINSKKTALLVDSSKFQQVYNYGSLDFSMLDYIICDREPTKDIAEACEQHHIQLIY